MDINKYNGEHYLSPTEYEALTNVDRELKLNARAVEEERERNRRCWECTKCNKCKRAFKMTTLCEDYKQRKRRYSKNA